MSGDLTEEERAEILREVGIQPHQAECQACDAPLQHGALSCPECGEAAPQPRQRRKKPHRAASSEDTPSAIGSRFPPALATAYRVFRGLSLPAQARVVGALGVMSLMCLFALGRSGSRSALDVDPEEDTDYHLLEFPSPTPSRRAAPSSRQLARSGRRGLLGAPLPSGATLRDFEPGDSSGRVDPKETYVCPSDWPKLSAFFRAQLPDDGWRRVPPKTPRLLSFRKETKRLLVFPASGGFALMGSASDPPAPEPAKDTRPIEIHDFKWTADPVGGQKWWSLPWSVRLVNRSSVARVAMIRVQFLDASGLIVVEDQKRVAIRGGGEETVRGKTQGFDRLPKTAEIKVGW